MAVSKKLPLKVQQVNPTTGQSETKIPNTNMYQNAAKRRLQRGY